MLTDSVIETLTPMFALVSDPPWTLNPDPMRAIFLKLHDEHNKAKSKTDNLPPIEANDRILMAEPKLLNSRTETAEPSLDKVRILNEEPRFT
jgi:hypothetical protein